MSNTGFRPVALALAFGLFAWAPAGAGEPVAAPSQTQYREMQGITHEFGSKFAAGYFLSEGGKCRVTLLVAEKVDLERAAPQTATRVRFDLTPRQGAGIGVAEGHSLNFTCGENATALLVEKNSR